MALIPHGLGANTATGPSGAVTPNPSAYIGGSPLTGHVGGGFVPISSLNSGLASVVGGGSPLGAQGPLSSPPPAPAPSAAAAPPASLGGGGGPAQFSFSSIDSFPGVANALALEQSGLGQLDAQLNAARQQAIINFGDPSLAKMAGFGLDPQAAAFAQQNYLSGNATMARLDKAHQQAAQAVINALAAHGILNSGDLGYREGQENQAYGNNVYDAQQAVLSQLSGLYNNYLNSRYGLEQNANNAQLDALSQFLSNPDAYASLFGGGGYGGDGGGGGAPPQSGSAPGGAATAARRAIAPARRTIRATPLPSTRVTGGRI